MPTTRMYACSCGRQYNAAVLERCPACGLPVGSRPAASLAQPSSSGAPPAGWFPDPNGLPSDRYWDGSGWTDQTRPQTTRPLAPVAADLASQQRAVNPYGDRSRGANPVALRRNGMGTAGLVLGILGMFLGWLFSLLAIIFGGIGVSRANRGEASNKGAALWGLWLGIVGLALWTLLGLILLA